MRTSLRALLLTAAALIFFGLCQPFAAQEKSSSALDKTVYDALGTVINHGARLYNDRAEYAACYHVYEAGLLTIKPFLAHRPELQKAIDEGLEKATGQTKVIDRAFTLRYVLRDVRAALKAAGPAITKKAAGKTLWDRLGGEFKVKRVVDDFVKLAAEDPAVDVTRGGRYALDDNAVRALKKMLVEFISSATGGPLRYTGKNMKELHKGMGITNAEFDATKADLKKALEMNGARAADIADVLGIVETTRKDIVEGKPAKKKKSKDQSETRKPKVFGSVSGKVTLDGKPARGQYLTLVANAGTPSFSTYINAEGAYSFWTPIPVGGYRVVIEPGPRVSEKLPAFKINIPARFRSALTSGLAIEIRENQNRFDVDLRTD
jgi:hemoglobin